MLKWSIKSGASAFEDGTSTRIRDLWQQSVYANPFASPPVLAHLARVAVAENATPIAALGTNPEGQPVALWPLVQSPSGRIEFLHGRLCDHGTALAQPGVGTAELAEGLAAVLETHPATHLFLTNLPTWDGSRQASLEALVACGWSSRGLEATADPVLSEEPGKDLAERLVAHVKGKSLRNYANRLAKQDGYAFEILGDETDLTGWAEDFCNCHDWRWAATDTPSRLASTLQRKEFLDLLRAWASAGSLLRFAIRVGGKRVACAVVLRGGDRLIYHRISHSPAHDRTRAATVLVRNLVLWMAENNKTTLDFGLGDESYKYRFATREERLWRVYGSKRRFSRDRITRSIEAAIRSSDSLQKTWDRVGNQWFRGRMLSKLRRTKSRLRQLRARIAGRRAPGVWPAQELDLPPRSSVHAASGKGAKPNAPCKALTISDLLARIEARWPLSPEDRSPFYERYHAGWIPYALCEGDDSSPLVWLRQHPHDPHQWWARANAAPGKAERVGETAQLLAGLRSLTGPENRILAEAGGTGGFAVSELRVAGFASTTG